MAKIVKKLTASEVKNAKTSEKERYLFDGDGLQLTIKTNGSKLWHFKYQSPITKKRRLVSFGSANDLSLADVREKVREWRNLIKKGIDPKEHFEEERLKALREKENTFGKMVETWLPFKKRTLSKLTYMNNFYHLKNHMLPKLKDVTLDKINVALVSEKVLDPLVEKGQLSTIATVITMLNDIMNMAVNYDYITHNPCVKITRFYKRKPPEHQKAVHIDDFPKFLKEMDQINSYRATNLMFKWQLLTMCRPCEASSLSWDEINWDTMTWDVPKERMKARRPHFVPLTDLMVELLEEAKKVSKGSKYVFESPTAYGKPIHSKIIATNIRKTSFRGKATAHGLRAFASTVMNEQEFNSDIIESLLAHAVGSIIRRTYDRSRYEKRRREYLEWWGNFCKENGLVI